MDRTIQVTVICGSAREVSYTRGLGRRIVRALEGREAAVELLDLRHHALPPMDPHLRRARADHPDPAVGRLFRIAEAADGFVFASPVYHNSFSGVLKNALDYLRIPDVRYKPVGLASHGGASPQAVDHLRQGGARSGRRGDPDPGLHPGGGLRRPQPAGRPPRTHRPGHPGPHRPLRPGADPLRRRPAPPAWSIGSGLVLPHLPGVMWQYKT